MIYMISNDEMQVWGARSKGQASSCFENWRDARSVGESETVGLAFVLRCLFLVLALSNETCKRYTQNLGLMEVFGLRPALLFLLDVQ